MKKEGKDDSFFEPLWKPKRSNGGASWAAWQKPPPPEPVYRSKDEWPSPKPRTDLVFAKSCVAENGCCTDARTATEPASMLLPSASEVIAVAIGADPGLARVASDGTFHTDKQLRSMSKATTRVRFQFRRDAEGVTQIYGIHTGASGDDSVRTVQVKWNANKTALEAELNGVLLIWTPPTVLQEYCH